MPLLIPKSLFPFILLPLTLLIPLIPLTPYALTATTAQPHHTTAYIRPKGEVDTLWTYSFYTTDHFWNKHGKRLPTFNHFKSHSFLLYAEYALNDRNSIWVNGGYSTVKESLNGNSNSIQDLELGWKFLIRQGTSLCSEDSANSSPSALTTQVIAIIPTGDKKASIRYNRFGAEIDLLYSDTFNWWNRCGWFDLLLGYRLYTGFPSDQIRASAAVGYMIFPQIPRLHLIASTHLEYGVFNGDSKGNQNNIILNSKYRLLNVQIECVINVYSQSSISIGAFQHVWGQNVGTGGGFFAGAWINF